jgi:hypothetical protein
MTRLSLQVVYTCDVMCIVGTAPPFTYYGGEI